jgi:hypothetical protein
LKIAQPFSHLAVQRYHEGKVTFEFHVPDRPWTFLVKYWFNKPGARLVRLARIGSYRVINIEYPPSIATPIAAAFHPAKLPIEPRA